MNEQRHQRVLELLRWSRAQRQAQLEQMLAGNYRLPYVDRQGIPRDDATLSVLVCRRDIRSLDDLIAPMELAN